MSTEGETSLDDGIEMTANMHWQRTRKLLINTPLQRGDRQRRRTVTALAVFKMCKKTAEAVRVQADVSSHLAEARC